MSQLLRWVTALRDTGPFGWVLLLLLVVLSIATWAVIVERWRTLKFLQEKSETFIKNFWEAKSIPELNLRAKDIEYSPAREIFRTGYNEMVRVIQAREKRGGGSGQVPFDTVKRAIHKARMVEEGQLSRNFSYLAISASACPFVGLFGTVVGVIRAFHDIGSSGTSSLASVAPGISEALIATALGLAAAIPAVVFYNFLISRAKRHLLLLDGFSVDFLNILERHFNIGKADSMPSAASATGSVQKMEP